MIKFDIFIIRRRKKNKRKGRSSSTPSLLLTPHRRVVKSMAGAGVGGGTWPMYRLKMIMNASTVNKSGMHLPVYRATKVPS
jgi:hypothetical protein